MQNSFIRIQEADFDLTTEVKALRKADPRVGAVVTFVGTVRDMNDGSVVKGMTLEHYPGMTEKALEEIISKAKDRWDIYKTLVIHRVGPLQPEDPFWKKEDTPEGARWVDARITDDAAMARWNK
ncbi:MAG: molybdenum cofactor biosynthesis protein MoaE [Polynucleobacter sp. 32-46-5]|nr:MAG: molybdenum cofactor biosynthesis protein MoaE [Polynucleobacter sp. 32-46-5]